MTNSKYVALCAVFGIAGCVLDDPGDPALSEIDHELVVSRYLSDRLWSSSSTGWGPIERDRSNGERAAGDGHTITLEGSTYSKGLGVHAPSDIRFQLGGACTAFRATIGVDDESASAGSVVFQVWADGAKLFDSGIMRGTSAGRAIDINVTARAELKLVVTDAGDGSSSDHADWGLARLLCDSASPLPPTNSSLTWKMLGLVIRNTDVSFTDPATGQSRRVTTRMTAAEEAGVIEAARKTPVHIWDWSDGMGRTTLDVVVTDGTVSSVSGIGSGVWVAPDNVSGLLDTYAPNGAYDSVFVMWDPDGGTGGTVPVCCYWGMGRGGNTNDATYASMPVFAEGTWGGLAPAEVFVHEWLHGSTAYYRGERGFNTPDPHENGVYGHPQPDSLGTWISWYTAMLSGEMVHSTTGVRAGLSSTVWESGTPTRPVGNMMGPPTHLRGFSGSGGISLYWTRNSKAEHYRIFRGTSPGTEVYIGWTPYDSMLDTGATPGKTYYYVVRSVSTFGINESNNSNRVSVTR
jgi:hypothetical protein